MTAVTAESLKLPEIRIRMPTSFNETVIEEFRANEGKVGGPFEGGDLLLLTTTGARSGTQRTTPLGYVRHGGLILLVGSNLGAPSHPGWYHNLLAHPVVRVEIGTRTFQALAVPAEGDRRDELFAHAVRSAPGYGDYQARTTRLLPVVVLERADPDGWQGPGEVRTLADKVMEVHTWLRGQLREVAAEVEAHFAERAAHRGPGEPPAPSLGLQIRQRCLAFCQALEFHHTSEDGHLFPGIARYHPHLGDTFARLADEHRTVARIQAALVELLAGIGIAEPARFRSELARMSAELNAHLDYEEETIVPLLAEVPWPPVPPVPPASAPGGDGGDGAGRGDGDGAGSA
ncbi:Deazaflavin-dependent nitroreductase [Streptomyces sp. ADI92-24]|nr:deazaflavin-dependent oxidoreductase (nitroreductase family) [Streptomyces sp. CEV 2-1]RPK44519.1 Deazaflavin-dependent nitroreductase [Streptomyces sp. ADI92-24]